MRKAEVKVSYQRDGENGAITLDQVFLTVGSRNLFHLEQMDDNSYWMSIGDHSGQCVHVMLYTKRATIHGFHRTEGPKPVTVELDGKPADIEEGKERPRV